MITLRPFEDSDRAFVLATWSRSARSATRLTDTEWRRRHGESVRKLLGAPHVSVVVATSDQASDEAGQPLIVGWLAHSERHFAHYVYVRSEYRGQGIARAMAKAARLALASEIGHTFSGPAMRWLRNKYKLREVTP